jgi:hypothetical protein
MSEEVQKLQTQLEEERAIRAKLEDMVTRTADLIRKKNQQLQLLEEEMKKYIMRHGTLAAPSGQEAVPAVPVTRPAPAAVALPLTLPASATELAKLQNWLEHEHYNRAQLEPRVQAAATIVRAKNTAIAAQTAKLQAYRNTYGALPQQQQEEEEEEEEDDEGEKEKEVQPAPPKARQAAPRLRLPSLAAVVEVNKSTDQKAAPPLWHNDGNSSSDSSSDSDGHTEEWRRRFRSGIVCSSDSDGGSDVGTIKSNSSGKGKDRDGTSHVATPSARDEKPSKRQKKAASADRGEGWEALPPPPQPAPPTPQQQEGRAGAAERDAGREEEEDDDEEEEEEEDGESKEKETISQHPTAAVGAGTGTAVAGLTIGPHKTMFYALSCLQPGNVHSVAAALAAHPAPQAARAVHLTIAARAAAAANAALETTEEEEEVEAEEVGQATLVSLIPKATFKSIDLLLALVRSLSTQPHLLGGRPAQAVEAATHVCMLLQSLRHRTIGELRARFLSARSAAALGMEIAAEEDDLFGDMAGSDSDSDSDKEGDGPPPPPPPPPPPTPTPKKKNPK